MPKLNREIILSNITGTREELQRIEAMLSSDEPVKPIHFQIAVQHAFHHLNFAWNARHWPMKRYTTLTRDDSDRAERFPTDLAFDDD